VSRVRLRLIAAAVYVLAWALSSWIEPRRETGVFPIDPPTPFLHYSPEGLPRGRVLVVHGMAASKETTQLISAALTDGGFEVYAIDLPGHGDSPVGFDVTFGERAIRHTLDRIGMNTIVVGHSLGAALLLDLAAKDQFSTMVLLSPAPTPIQEIHADRVLLVIGRFDIPRFRAFAPIVAGIGGDHVEFRTLPWGGHSAAIFNPGYMSSIVAWLAGEAGSARTVARLALLVTMLISGVVIGVGFMPRRSDQSPPVPIRLPTILVRYVVACGGALLILKAVNPLRWLSLFGTDYLIGFLFIAGVLLWMQKHEALRRNGSALFRAVMAAAFVIVVLGYAASPVLRFGLGNGRWWRFPLIALASVPLFAFDELNLRRIRSLWKSIAGAILTRALLWAFLAMGALLLNRESAFLVLITHLIVLFWLALWFAAGVIRRNTQDPVAAALFSALVQGWAFAAWFIKL
jgi:pimeloyl-ACP methyl ester carboxylesterase